MCLISGLCLISQIATMDMNRKVTCLDYIISFNISNMGQLDWRLDCWQQLGVPAADGLHMYLAR